MTIEIQKGINRLTEGRTSFVIAHRLKTIENADRILVIHQGEIIESGTHQELLQKKGVYFNMYDSQVNLGGKTAEGPLYPEYMINSEGGGYEVKTVKWTVK
jgi:ATP-binding cassette, subfamily B, multidrug efflux pump